MTHTPEELTHKFWKHLRSDRTVMLGLPGTAAGRPMTAITEDKDDHGPIWFFTSKDTDLGKIGGPTKAEMAFMSKGHDLYATAHGLVTPDNDPAKIEELWNPYVAAWFEGGKSDPKLQLIRFDGQEAEIWLDANSFLEGAKMMFGGADPKEEFKDNVAKVRFG